MILLGAMPACQLQITGAVGLRTARVAPSPKTDGAALARTNRCHRLSSYNRGRRNTL